MTGSSSQIDFSLPSRTTIPRNVSPTLISTAKSQIPRQPARSWSKKASRKALITSRGQMLEENKWRRNHSNKTNIKLYFSILALEEGVQE
jgi:hypothetical protein